LRLLAPHRGPDHTLNSRWKHTLADRAMLVLSTLSRGRIGLRVQPEDGVHPSIDARVPALYDLKHVWRKLRCVAKEAHGASGGGVDRDAAGGRRKPRAISGSAPL